MSKQTPSLETLKASFPGAEVMERRGKVYLNQMDVDRILDGIPLSFTRRRYSACTYTWVQAFIDGQWVDLGDPWPCLMPSTKSLVVEINRRLPQTEHTP